jgi:CRP/FNR family transcriptional regulator, cyclic AMP receptor protein
VARLGPGDTIGEVAIVRHSLRTATVISITPLELLHFTADAVKALTEEIPQFKAALQATSDERIANDQEA